MSNSKPVHDALISSYKLYKPLFFYIAVYYLIGLIPVWGLGHYKLLDVDFLYYFMLIAAYLGVAFIAKSVHVYFFQETVVDDSRLNTLGLYYCEMFTLQDAIDFAVYVTLICFLMYTFSTLKQLLPFIVPFHADGALHLMDKFLHGGHEPWRFFQQWLRTPWFIVSLNFCYDVWFVFLFGILFHFGTQFRRSPLARQYVYTYTLTWSLLGTVAALLFASGGPCYYAKLMRLAPSQDPFHPLLQTLVFAQTHYHVWVYHTQVYLWQSYIDYITKGHFSFAAGISAMPSLHVGTAALFALVMQRTNKWLGLFFWCYTIIILVASICLGWHYAIDGYVSIASVVLLWCWVGRRLSRFNSAL